ncbi:MAG: reverse transcriptase-like protein [Vicinamibacteria bacterium]|nr:reverse transcriptase-like protein [Vicinamibacteria bacterium]
MLTAPVAATPETLDTASTHNTSEVTELFGHLGKTTNNVAEYQALLHALRFARDRGARRIEVFYDSELLARPVNGDDRVRLGVPESCRCTASRENCSADSRALASSTSAVKETSRRTGSPTGRSTRKAQVPAEIAHPI